MTSESDASLVARARRGEESAFEALVRRHLRAAMAVGLSVLRDVTEAEDVAQESLIAAWQAIDDCRDPERFVAWLLTIVRNRARNRLAAKKVRAPTDVVLEAQSFDPLERVGERQRLLAGLETLPQVQREVVLLHDLESWTHAEIAVALGLTEVNSRQNLFVARRALRAFLGQDGADDA
jgi:RNA polymerase sigma-70 factor (ECF subfamily)